MKDCYSAGNNCEMCENRNGCNNYNQTKVKPGSVIFEGVALLVCFGISRLLGLVALFFICKRHDWI